MQIPADIMKEIGLLGKGNVSLNVEGEKLVITVPEEGQKKKKGS
jgi:antitoxin component of MazEF toxin-antitoxin module